MVDRAPPGSCEDRLAPLRVDLGAVPLDAVLGRAAERVAERVAERRDPARGAGGVSECITRWRSLPIGRVSPDWARSNGRRGCCSGCCSGTVLVHRIRRAPCCTGRD